VGDILIQVDLSPHCSKSNVPAVYPTSAHSLFLAFFAFNEINKLRLINRAQNSDSLYLHSRLGIQQSLILLFVRIPDDADQRSGMMPITIPF
jgi:hypothetical protein